MASLVVVSQSFTIERDVEFEIVRPEWHWVGVNLIFFLLMDSYCIFPCLAWYVGYRVESGFM